MTIKDKSEEYNVVLRIQQEKKKRNFLPFLAITYTDTGVSTVTGNYSHIYVNYSIRSHRK